MFPWYFPQHNIPLLYSGMIYISVNSLEAYVLAFTARTYTCLGEICYISV